MDKKSYRKDGGLSDRVYKATHMDLKTYALVYNLSPKSLYNGHISVRAAVQLARDGIEVAPTLPKNVQKVAQIRTTMGI